jgi:hypothetical protein
LALASGWPLGHAKRGFPTKAQPSAMVREIAKEAKRKASGQPFVGIGE